MYFRDCLIVTVKIGDYRSPTRNRERGTGNAKKINTGTEEAQRWDTEKNLKMFVLVLRASVVIFLFLSPIGGGGLCYSHSRDSALRLNPLSGFGDCVVRHALPHPG
jgi:hypothetical protein